MVSVLTEKGALDLAARAMAFAAHVLDEVGDGAGAWLVGQTLGLLRIMDLLGKHDALERGGGKAGQIRHSVFRVAGTTMGGVGKNARK